MSDTNTRYVFSCSPCCYSFESNTNHCPECGNEECKVDWEIERDLEAEVDELKEQVATLTAKVTSVIELIQKQDRMLRLGKGHTMGGQH